jgi:hypothetical protein
VDALYILLLAYPFLMEMHEITRAVMQRGYAGFVHYWGFWNIVDWATIIAGAMCIQLWIQFWLATSSDNLQQCLDSNYDLKPESAFLGKENLEALLDDLNSAVFVSQILYFVMALNSVAIMSKFAKSFQCNARLEVVDETVQLAKTDVFHFMVIFWTVFIGYCIAGHLLFGNDMMHFNSMGASINTCFMCLLGDFGWYSDLTEVIEDLGSGIPYWVVAVFFWSFMIFTTLVLMNMLLAIVMDNYVTIMTRLETQPDAPAIWVQTQRYFDRRKKYKNGKWIPLLTIYEEILKTDGNPHPDPNVNEESLRLAFPTMKQEQAEFLMKWLIKDFEAHNSSKKEDLLQEELYDIKLFQEWLSLIGENLHVMHMCFLKCRRKLDSLERGDRLPERPTLGSSHSCYANSTVSVQLEKQLTVMRELCGQFGKQQESTQRLADALHELTRVAPAPRVATGC